MAASAPGAARGLLLGPRGVGQAGAPGRSSGCRSEGAHGLTHHRVRVRQRLAIEALDGEGPHGLFLVTGMPANGGPNPVDTDTLMRNIVLRNQLLLGTVNASRSAYELALRELGQAMFLFPRSVRTLITDRVSIQEAPAIITGHGGIQQVIELASGGTTCVSALGWHGCVSPHHIPTSSHVLPPRALRPHRRPDDRGIGLPERLHRLDVLAAH
ncbi:hypothetical protein JGU66_27550 [Myxococcaceae bacterium JPH2]|nr:hypothetical protein [Myxococcaceae bacterium JPH2]